MCNQHLTIQPIQIQMETLFHGHQLVKKDLKVQEITPEVAQIAADSAASKALEYGMKTLSVEVKVLAG